MNHLFRIVMIVSIVFLLVVQAVLEVYSPGEMMVHQIQT